MIAPDTNVLVRYLVQDDEEQAAQATAAIRGAVDRGENLFLSGIVLCELVWVLEGVYRRSREEVAGALGQILTTRGVVVADRDEAEQALEGYRSGRGDFADHLIGAPARQGGADRVLTFDRALLYFPGSEAP